MSGGDSDSAVLEGSTRLGGGRGSAVLEGSVLLEESVILVDGIFVFLDVFVSKFSLPKGVDGSVDCSLLLLRESPTSLVDDSPSIHDSLVLTDDSVVPCQCIYPMTILNITTCTIYIPGY